MTTLSGGDAEPLERHRGDVDRGLADDGLGRDTGRDLDGREQRAAVGQAAVGCRAVRIGVRGDQPSAAADRDEGRVGACRR